MISGKANGINIGINLRKIDQNCVLPVDLPEGPDKEIIKILADQFTNKDFEHLELEKKLAHIFMAERIANGQFKDKNGFADNPNIQRAYLVLSYKYQCKCILFREAKSEVTVQKMIEYGLEEYL